MVILDPSIDERTVAPSLDRFLGVIRNDGGSVDKVDIWGRRRLAYEIQKHTEGIYAVVNLTATSASTQELNRQLGLSEAVLRTKVLRADEVSQSIGKPNDNGGEYRPERPERSERRGSRPPRTPRS
ncbi:30S ribosomal protein S6 [Amnibacterium endophyticum]|uniref:Small ribosomal subunit protein bS6 n=1 Tax=Amnibacterium endophyticum TaxID=2109337 RepID=A0ABW4LBK0_9MICO